MTWSSLVCGAMVLGGCGLCSAIEAISPAEPAAPAGDANNSFPYAVIVSRNAFGLNPAPIPTAPPAAPGPDLPEVIFSGTTGLQGKMRAHFAVKSKDAKKQETTTYLPGLAEGETSGPVQVIRIDPSGDEVEIMNSGTRVVLNMKDNGFEKKGPPAPGAPALSGFRQLAGSPGVQLPGAQAQPAAAATTYDGGTGINLGRTLVSPTRGNINVQGGGPPIGGGPINPAALLQPNINTSVAPIAPNTVGSGIRTAGPTAPPSTSVPTTFGNAPTGGTPPNSTPPATISTRIVPPMPPMP
jgi:hypothetical protein